MGCEAKGLGDTWGKREPPQVHIVRECLHDSMMRALMPFLRASWKPLCTHTCSMASKQQALEVCVWLQGCSLVVGHRDVVGPECCRGWVQALWGGQAGRAQRSSCCKRAAGMYEALAWDGLGASLEPMVRICGFWWVSAADCLIRKK